MIHVIVQAAVSAAAGVLTGAIISGMTKKKIPCVCPHCGQTLCEVDMDYYDRVFKGKSFTCDNCGKRITF